jgi:hypothetical protein
MSRPSSSEPAGDGWPAGLRLELHGFGMGPGSLPIPQNAETCSRLAWATVCAALEGAPVALDYLDMNADEDRTRRLGIHSFPTVRVLLHGEEIARSTVAWMGPEHFLRWLRGAIALR